MTDKQFTILIVDDNLEILDAVADFLEPIGYKCKKAMNGKEAWEIFEASQSEIDLVITDFDMPIMGGKELIELIRKKDSEKPIILMSARESKELVGLGATKIMRKPISSIEDLVAIIRELLLGQSKGPHVDRETLAKGKNMGRRLTQGTRIPNPPKQKH